METDKGLTESNVHSHMKYHNVKDWIVSADLLLGRGPDRIKSCLLAGAHREEAFTIQRAVERRSERTILRRLARYFDCEESPEAIRKSVEKTPERRVIRHLARALAKE